MRLTDQLVRSQDEQLLAWFRRRVSAPEADDLVQEVWLRAARGLPELRDEDAVGPWLGRVARSVWVDHLRRARPSEPLPEIPVLPPLDADATELVASWLPAFVEALPEPYAEAVRLVELEGVSQAELARRLDLSLSGTRSRVQRGRALLRESLLACCAVHFDGGEVVDVQRTCGC